MCDKVRQEEGVEIGQKYCDVFPSYSSIWNKLIQTFLNIYYYTYFYMKYLFVVLTENLEAAIYNLSQTTAQFRNKFLEIDDSKYMNF